LATLVLATLPHLDRRSLLSSEACCAKEDGEGGWQHLECSAQDSHFWSTIDKAPQKPSIKLTKIAHISHFSKLSNPKL
jgi:hypothetical protein